MRMGAEGPTTTGDLEVQLAPGGVVQEGDALGRYQVDWSGDHRGRAHAVVRPRSTEEVARVIRHCASAGIPVVPQGGHTGLVNAGTPSRDGTEVVISLERLNRIRRVDPIDFSMVVEAGCILQDVRDAAESADLYFPLSLGAQGSCQIGGNIATNAGGLNVLRYGMMRDLVLGIEAVLPDGRIFEDMRGLRKDNTGYDLKQLFIGSEGTLGIVTAAVLKLSPRPTQSATAILGCASVEAVVRLFGHARRDLGDLLSAFELMTRDGMVAAMRAFPELREPFDPPAPAYVILEASTSALIDLQGTLERFLEGRLEDGAIDNGAVAASGAQTADFWRFREGVIEWQVRRGRHLRTDVSVAISALPAFVVEAEAAIHALGSAVEAFTYGHVGDGNLHVNVLPPPDMPEAEIGGFLDRCEDLIYDIVDRMGGSISAEHGIGRKKMEAFLRRIDPTRLELMQKVKATIDPAGVMSPGRILGPAPTETGAAWTA